MNANFVIDVCLTCGREAKFPFCEHRTGTGWCIGVAVKPIGKADREWIVASRSSTQEGNDG